MDLHWKTELVDVINDALLRLYDKASGEQFCIRVQDAFGLLFPELWVLYHEIIHGTGTVANLATKSSPIPHHDFVEKWERWSSDYPVIVYLRTGGTKAVFQIQDLLPPRKFKKTSFYREFWSTLKSEYQITAVIHASDRFVVVSVNSRSSFTKHDIELMKLMQIHFSRAYSISSS